MNQQKLRLSVLVAALTTTAVFAGTYATLEKPMASPASDNTIVITETETVVATPQDTAATAAIAPTAEPAPYVDPARPAVIAEPKAISEPAITVTEQRLTVDERITLDVMDALRRNETLSGKVGVESHDQVVTLSGWLMSNGQVMRANRDARSVDGVRYVVNEIRPKVGAVTY
jgi:hypothetical protein